MEGTLSKIISNHKSVEKQNKETNSLLSQLLKVERANLAVEKEKQKQSRRAVQAEKRRSADRVREKNLLEKILKELQKDKGDDKDKKKGNIFERLLKGIGSLGTSIIAGAGRIILSTLGTIGKTVLRGIGSVGKGVVNALKPMVTNIITKLGSVASGILSKFGIVTSLTATVAGLAKMIAAPLALAAGGGFAFNAMKENMEYGGGRAGATGLDIESERRKLFASLGPQYRNKSTGAKLRALSPEDRARAEELDAARLELKRLVTERDRQLGAKVGTGEFRTVNRRGGRGERQEIMRSLTDEERAAIEKRFQNDAAYVRSTYNIQEREKDAVGKAADSVNNSVQEMNNLYQNALKFDIMDTNKLNEDIEKQLEQLNTNMSEQIRLLEQQHNDNVDYFGFQTGGFVGRVPYQGGNGDRFRTSVEPGSVVLNQRAAGMFQRGGQVPVMLEQGEQVFGPRDPAAGIAMMMNSMIPRFQEGGQVKPTDGVGDTGSGYTINGYRDANGRPIVLSEGAAAGFEKMMKESGGLVKTTDVTSAQRSRAKNTQEGGAPNSNHLYGNAVDISVGSSTYKWMRANDGAGGFYWNNYSPNHPWHWDFKGKDAATKVPPVGTEKGIAKDNAELAAKDKGGTTPMAFLQGLLAPIGAAVGGNAGAQIEGLLGGISKSLGPFMDVMKINIGGGLGSMFGGGGGNNTSSTSGGSSPGGNYGESSLIAAMNNAGMTDRKERAAFLAQMAHESGNFRYDEEIASGEAYEGRSDLGNTQPGDGKRFKGRGYIQLTGRANYRRYGDLVGQDLISNPDLAKDPNIAAAIALEYWNQRGLGAKARAGDFDAVTYGINGGYNGKADRDAKYQKYLAQGLQTGGVVNMGSTGSYASRHMMQKSQENFAQMIASASSPVVVPMPVGGGNESQVVPQDRTGTPFPSLPAEDTSIVSMEYKYRITMGASV